MVQGAGGTLNATTSPDRTNYFETVPAQHLELMLWLEADRMGRLVPALTQDTLDNQRDVVKNERRQRYENTPYGDTWLRLLALLYPPGHPYHHATIGSMADLDRVRPGHLRRVPHHLVRARQRRADRRRRRRRRHGRRAGRALTSVCLTAAGPRPAAPDGMHPDPLGGPVRETVSAACARAPGDAGAPHLRRRRPALSRR